MTKKLFHSECVKCIFLVDYILECPYGWIDARHLNFGCLYLSKDVPMNWDDAQHYCETQEYENSHLVEIYDSMQQTFLQEELLQYKNSYVWWIGLTGNRNDGNWKWDFSGKISTFFSWGINEPNGREIECVSLWYQQEFSWCDVWCGWEFFPICQFDF